MFTGIVQKMLVIYSVSKNLEFSTVSVDFITPPENLSVGASVSINGVCLTVTYIQKNIVFFDIIPETMKCTSLRNLIQGDIVNIERSAQVGDEIGGHMVSGHVDDTVRVVRRHQNVITFSVHPKWMKYILPKGFIALNGCSLTIVNPIVNAATFEIHFIPETLSSTTFGSLKKDDLVNMEIDHQTKSIVHTTEKFLDTHINITLQV